MLGALLILSIFGILTFEYWYLVSYAGFLFLVIKTNTLSHLNTGRNGVLVLLGVGGVGFMAFGIRKLLPIIDRVL